MIFGPVLPVELVTSSRRARYFVIRVVYAAILLITLWTQYESSISWRLDSNNPLTPSLLSEFANQFFESFAIVQVLAVLLLTPALVAGTIAEEKERRTLEYLLCTDLRNWEIVLGKWFARLLHLLILIAVGWPVLALLTLLGGVAMENILACFAITASTALATSALSIWSSVQARRGRDAVVRVYVILLAAIALPLVVSSFAGFSWVALPGIGPAAIDQLLALNPLECLSRAITQSGTDWQPVIQLMRNQAVLTVPCLLFSLWRVRYIYLKQTFGRPGRGDPASSRMWRPAMGSSPVAWKELFAERPAFSLGIAGLIAQVLLSLAAIIPAAWLLSEAVAGTGGDSFDELRWYVIVVGTATSCVGLLAVAVHAAGSVAAERERQTWETLLSTPLEPRQIVQAKVAGSLYAMRWMFAVQLILWMLGMVGQTDWLLIVPLVLLELFVFGVFVSLVGLLFSIQLKTSLRAMGATVGTAVFFGGAYLFCCVPFIWNGPGESEFVLAACIPYLLALPLAIRFEDFGSMNNFDSLFGAYVAGIVFYAVLTVVLYFVTLSIFDELTGRPRRSI